MTARYTLGDQNGSFPKYKKSDILINLFKLTHFDWSDSISLRSKSIFFLKVSSSILFEVNLDKLI
jgi:hypothetical protein